MKGKYEKHFPRSRTNHENLLTVRCRSVVFMKDFPADTLFVLAVFRNALSNALKHFID